MNPDSDDRAHAPTLPPLRLDPDGIPILEDIVPDVADPFAPPSPASAEAATDDLKSRLLRELEPQLHDLAKEAFTASVKSVALDFKRSFERELNTALHQRLDQMVEQALERAAADADNK